MMNVIVFDELEMITPLPDAQRVIIILFHANVEAFFQKPDILDH